MSTIFPSVTVHVPYKYDMHTASLFGSYTQNEAHEDSDIDLLLEESPGFRPLNVFGVAKDLHRLSGKKLMCSRYLSLIKKNFETLFLKKP